MINASPQQVSQENYTKRLRGPQVSSKGGEEGSRGMREGKGRGGKGGGGEYLALTTLRPFS